jgi:excinuclease ABC subunit C
MMISPRVTINILLYQILFFLSSLLYDDHIKEILLCQNDQHTIYAGLHVILDTVKALPLKPGVYRMIDKSGQVLYVGKAKSLKNRVRSYTLVDQLPTRLQRMVFATASMEIIHTKTEVEALILESQLIKKLQPKYNILLKDDKSFPHIYIQKGHDFPQIYKKRGVNEQEAHCFGPFATIDAVETTTIASAKDV